MSEIVFILFQVIANPDGSREMSDVALTVSESVCNVIAHELNVSPRKPPTVQFGCRKAPVRA